MTLENKSGMNNFVELAQKEDLSTKHRALELYDNGLFGTIEIGTFDGLAKIHSCLLQDTCDFAGRMRTINFAKGGFRFTPPFTSPQPWKRSGRYSGRYSTRPTTVRFT